MCGLASQLSPEQAFSPHTGPTHDAVAVPEHGVGIMAHPCQLYRVRRRYLVLLLGCHMRASYIVVKVGEDDNNG